jgi:lysosomal alpha-mannosidase
MALWNSMAQTYASSPVMVPVGLPAGVTTYAVYDSTGAAIPAQLVPLSPADLVLRASYYAYNASVTMTWLAFQATLPPAGYATFFIMPAASAEEAPLTHESVVRRLRVGGGLRSKKASFSSSDVEVAGDQTISNGVLTLTIDGSSGLLFSYSNAQTGLTTNFGQTFYWYNSSVGTHEDGQASGAYIFRPNSSEVFDVATDPVTVTLITGPVVSEARQVFAGWMSQKIRLWANATSVDFDMTVGPIPFNDGLGREVITRYTTDFDSNATWFSDSNCRDSNKRVFNYRPSWNMTVNEPVAGNYVPVNCFTYLSDVTSGRTLSVVTDRSQAGASLADGALEIMIQRRLQHDDSRGVGEPLNETGLDGNGLVVRTLHRVSLDPNPAAAAVNRRAAVADLLYRPQARYAALGTTTPAQFVASYKPSFTGVQAALPANVHLLTAHSWGPGKLLLRVSHSFEANEGGALGTNVNVNLAAIFSPSILTLTACTEMTLTGNQPLSAATQTTYNVTDGPVTTLPVVPTPPQGAGMTITLTPMGIRTFLCTTAAAEEEAA